MGQESSLCSPISDVPLIGCVKKDTTNEDEKMARDEFDTNRTQTNNKSSSHSIGLSETNTKAITCAHLIGSIIRNYFESLDNKCDQSGFQSFDTQKILENIVIIGNAPRNYLLKRAINSIDIAINTRELVKIQLIHLRKYHEKSQKTNSQCILWRLYLNKFITHEEKQNEKNKKKYAYIADCNYILNAYFIVNYILTQHLSSHLRDKLSIHRDDITKIYQLQIIDEMLYPMFDSYNLDGIYLSIFDITDKAIVYKQLFATNKTAPVEIHSKHRIKLKEIKRISNINENQTTQTIQTIPTQLHHPTQSESVSLSFSMALLQNTHFERLESLQTFQFRINDKPFYMNTNKNNNKKKKNLLLIELPFYEVKLRQVMKIMDFSINTVFLQMSDVLEMKQMNKEYKDNKNCYINDDIIINYDWTRKIKNGLPNYNALADFKKKQLTHPFVQNAIDAHGIDAYFWKIVRFGVLLNSWKIDKKIINLTKEKYDIFLKNTLKDITYWNKVNRNENQKNHIAFVDMMFNQHICYNNSIKQYIRMLQIFSVLNVHSNIILIMAKNNNFTNYFVKTIQNLQTIHKKQIVQLFAKQGYVTEFAHA